MASSLQQPKISLKVALQARGMTATDLARKAQVTGTTVHTALVHGGTRKTNDTSALAIARALGMSVDDIEWANGLTEVGRPAHTGGIPCVQKRASNASVCPVHNVELPLSNVCDLCA